VIAALSTKLSALDHFNSIDQVVSKHISAILPYIIFNKGADMTKTELIAKIADKAKLTKAQAESAVAAFQCAVTTELVNDGKVTLIGFGTFSTLKRAARTGRNPQTGKPLKIEAKRVGKFTTGKLLKDLDACKASCKKDAVKPAAKAVAKAPAKAKKK
jgi:DNA-binding protein HU-beta